MYCSTKKFIDITKKIGVQSHDLHALLSVVKGLHTRRGSLIKSQKFQDALVEKFPEVVKIIQLLGSVDKLTLKDLKALLSHVDASGTSSFTVTGSDHARIDEALKKQFGEHEVKHVTSDDMTIQVAGNGRWYKRSLAKDLDKILK